MSHPVDAGGGMPPPPATDRLIASLAADAAPIAPLGAPWRRALAWQAIVLGVLLLFFLFAHPRHDLGVKLDQVGFWLEALFEVATGVAAAFACFIVALPDRDPRWALLPLPPILAWLTGIGGECLEQVSRMGWRAFTQGTSPDCAVVMLSASLPLVISLLLMQRHAGRTRPRLTFALGMIAVSGFASAILNFFHGIDAAATVLVWHLGSALVIILVWTPLGGWLATKRLDRAAAVLRRASRAAG